MGILSALKKFFFSKAAQPTLNKRAYLAGTIIYSSYSTQLRANYDRNPLALVLFSGVRQTRKGQYHYTHALNLNVLDFNEKAFLLKTIYAIHTTTTVPTPQAFYLYLKTNYPSIIKKSYRTYFTAYLNGKYVSPGFSFGKVPLRAYNDSYIVQINKIVMGVNVMHKNKIKNESVIETKIKDNNLQAKMDNTNKGINNDRR